MKTLLILSLSLTVLLGCVEEEEAAPNKAHIVIDIQDIPIKWNRRDIPLNLSDEFSDEEIVKFKKMIKQWDDSAPGVDFFSYPIPLIENKDYNDLENYRDGEFGIYKSHNWFNELSPAALAITQFYGYRRHQGTPSEYFEIISADIIINYKDHSYDPENAFNWYDLPTIVLHEMGHFLGLKHNDVRESIMYPSLGSEELKRDLIDYDITSIVDLYQDSSKLFLNSFNKNAFTQDNENYNNEDELIRWIVELRSDRSHKMYITKAK